MTEEEHYQIIVDKFVFKVRKGYYYCSNDSLVKIENGFAKLGVSDFLQKTGGDVAFVELPTVGTNVKQFDEIGQFETIGTGFSLEQVSANIPPAEFLKCRGNVVGVTDHDGVGWIHHSGFGPR